MGQQLVRDLAVGVREVGRSGSRTDVTCREILDLWAAGRRDEALNLLAEAHSALTAVVLVQGTLDSKLTRSDCCMIANGLMDMAAAAASTEGQRPPGAFPPVEVGHAAGE